MDNKIKMLLTAIATLMGTVVGAGFLGMPKAFTLTGFIPGLVIMVIVSIVMFFMCLLVTELTLNTKSVYQMPGMISKYWGSKMGFIGSLIFALISFGAMVAYLIGCADIISHYTGVPIMYCMIVYFLTIFFLVYKGLKIVEKAEFYLGLSLIIFLVILWLIMGGSFEINNLLSFETTDLILPLGVIIFSFGGYNVMTQVELITNGDKDLMVKTSLIGIIIPFLFFLTFTILMLGVYGSNVSDIATESLTGVLGVIGNLIAFLAMTSSYIISGLLLKDMLVDDYNMNEEISSLIAMLIPFLFTLFSAPSFINTLAFTGSVVAGLFAILISVTVLKHRKRIRKVYYKTPGGWFTPVFAIIFFAIALISLLV